MAGIKSLIAGVAVAAVAAGSAFAETTIRIQSVISAKADEVTMLQAFADDVEALTGGSLKFEILPAGAVVGVRETLDAVDKGLIEGGFAW
ncbi:MAG: C4-dicarboxylate ABC transporter substrate-binding protein, partial [Pseudomonadota bacterium]